MTDLLQAVDLAQPLAAGSHPRIVVSVAHHPYSGKDYDPGAVFIDPVTGWRYAEADWSRGVCAALMKALAAHGIPALLIDEPLAATVNVLKRMTRGSVMLAVEPHLNAGPWGADYALVITHRGRPRAAGGMVGGARTVPPGALSPAFVAAEALLRELAPIRAGGGFRARGEHGATHPRPGTGARPLIGADGQARRLAFIDGHPHPALITETGFLTAPGFAAWVFRPDIIEAVAQAHARAIAEAWATPWWGENRHEGGR